MTLREDKRKKNPTEFREKLLNTFRSVAKTTSLERVFVHQGTYQHWFQKEKGVYYQSAEDVEGVIENFIINDSSTLDNRFLFSENVKTTAYNLSFSGPMEEQAELAFLSIDAKDSVISASEVTFYQEGKVDFEVPSISLNGINIESYLEHKVLNGQMLTFSQPSINIQRVATLERPEEALKDDFYEFCRRFSEDIQLGTLLILDATLNYEIKNPHNKDTSTHTAEGLHFELQEMEINPESYKDDDRVFFAKQFYMGFDEFSSATKRSKTRFNTSSFCSQFQRLHLKFQRAPLPEQVRSRPLYPCRRSEKDPVEEILGE